MNPIQIFVLAIAGLTFASTLLINPVFASEKNKTQPPVPGEGRQESNQTSFVQKK